MRGFRTSHLLLLAVFAVGAGLPAATVAAAPASAATATYTIIDLGSLGGDVTNATAINAYGQVTGYSYLSKFVPTCLDGGTEHRCHPYHAFLWSNGKMTDLGTLGGAYSQGRAIDGSGEVVGWATVPGETANESLWNGKRVTALLGLTGFNPDGINDSGQIVGNCGPDICEISGGMAALPNPANSILCGDIAINNNGQVLGNCVVDNQDNTCPVVWTKGSPTVLATLGGMAATATAINNNGQVVGTSQTSTSAVDGVLWSNDTLTDLGPNFSPAAINDSGVIVGGQFVDSDGALQNLNNLIPAGSGYQIESATGINDNGQIIVNAVDTTTNQQHALLLTSN